MIHHELFPAVVFECPAIKHPVVLVDALYQGSLDVFPVESEIFECLSVDRYPRVLHAGNRLHIPSSQQGTRTIDLGEHCLE